MTTKTFYPAVLALASCLLGAACVGGGADLAEAVAEAEQGAGQFCGGIAAVPCPNGLMCVDDPTDDCDPNQGGADCGGTCVKKEKKPKKPNCKDPGRTYMSHDTAQCATLLFPCAYGQVSFYDQCGCGCEPAP